VSPGRGCRTGGLPASYRRADGRPQYRNQEVAHRGKR
jgi:hypothetical protein